MRQSLGLGQHRIADSFEYQLAVGRLFAKQADKQPEREMSTCPQMSSATLSMIYQIIAEFLK